MADLSQLNVGDILYDLKDKTSRTNINGIKNGQEINSFLGVENALADKTDDDAVAPEFNDETAYSTGEMVYKDGQLYKFDSDHAAGAWDASEVSPTTVAAEFNQLKNTLSNLKVDLMTKLWENPNPTSSFAQQNIELSSSDYDMLLLIYNANVNSGNQRYLSNVTIKGKSVMLDISEYVGSSPNYIASNRIRYGTYIDNTHYSFTDCIVTGNGTDNTLCVPIAIYGIRTTMSVRVTA